MWLGWGAQPKVHRLRHDHRFMPQVTPSHNLLLTATNEHSTDLLNTYFFMGGRGPGGGEGEEREKGLTNKLVISYSVYGERRGGGGGRGG